MNSHFDKLLSPENPIPLDPYRTITLTTGHFSLHEVGFIVRSLIEFLTQNTELNIIIDSLKPFEIMKTEGLQINLSRVFFVKSVSIGYESMITRFPSFSYFVNNGGNFHALKLDQKLNEQTNLQFLLYLSSLSLHLIIVAWYRSFDSVEFLLNNRLMFGNIGIFSWPKFFPDLTMNQLLIEKKLGSPIYLRNWRHQIQFIINKNRAQEIYPHQLDFGF